MRKNYETYFWFIPIVVAILSTLVVFGYSSFLDGEYWRFWTGVVYYVDFFTLYKSVFLIFSGLLVIVFFSFYLFVIRRLNISFETALVFIYMILLTVSVLRSDLSYIPFFGILDRFEGLLVLTSYLLLFLYSIIIISSFKCYKYLTYTMIAHFLVLFIIGFGQFFGYDILSWDYFMNLLLPNDLKNLGVILFSTKGRVDLLFYNSNYVGQYVSIAFPFFLIMYIRSRSKITSIGFGFLSIMSFFLMIAARSRAGIVGAIFASIIVTALMVVLNQRNKLLRRSPIILVYIVVFLILNNYANGSLSYKLSAFDPRFEAEILAREVKIKNIVLNKEKISIEYEDEVLITEWSDRQLSFLLNGDRQEIYRDSIGLMVGYNSDIRYSTRVVSEIPILDLDLKGVTIIFAKYPDTIKIAGARNVFYDEVVRSETSLPFLRDSFGSFRGFIWKKTIPLIKENFWFGNGPDTLAAYFPHYDVISMLNAFGRTNMIVDKPHNYYLQVAHDTGVLSLIILLTLFGYYIIQSIKLQLKVRKDSELKSISLAILAGVIGYLVAAIFNDSTVHVAPLFWVLLGTGFATNRLLIENIESLQDNLGLEGQDPQR